MVTKIFEDLFYILTICSTVLLFNMHFYFWSAFFQVFLLYHHQLIFRTHHKIKYKIRCSCKKRILSFFICWTFDFQLFGLRGCAQPLTINLTSDTTEYGRRNLNFYSFIFLCRWSFSFAP